MHVLDGIFTNVLYVLGLREPIGASSAENTAPKNMLKAREHQIPDPEADPEPASQNESPGDGKIGIVGHERLTNESIFDENQTDLHYVYNQESKSRTLRVFHPNTEHLIAEYKCTKVLSTAGAFGSGNIEADRILVYGLKI